MPHPQAIFEIGFFKKNPEPFFKLAKELYPGSFRPTPSHHFIRLLEKKGVLLRHYTQNIDTLERLAGVSDDKLIEAHGTFYTAHCIKCRKLFSQEYVKDEIFKDAIPQCDKSDCEGVVKPDIVFFGENLPDRFYSSVGSDFARCDLLIVMGTSLTVQPFASLVERVPSSTPRLLINMTKVGVEGHDPMALMMRLLGRGGGAFDFDSKKNTRDVARIGPCDDGCRELADLLGWKEELEEMIKGPKLPEAASHSKV